MEPDQLIEDYLPLARSIAQQVWRNAPHALELDEMNGIANLALVWAAKRWHGFCQEKGYSPDALEYFKPFVVRRVRGALIDAIRASDWATRSLRSRAKQLQEAGQDQGATEKQMAERSGMSIQDVRSTIREMARRPVSLEAEEVDPAANHDVESSVVASDILSKVVATIETLSQEQQVVVALHYHQGMQLQQVAQVMRITESRASQLHAKAVLVIYGAMREAATHEES